VLSFGQPRLQTIAFFVQPAGTGDLAIQESQFQGKGLEALAALAGGKVHAWNRALKYSPCPWLFR
jgi:hypothetical protein